ncbi:MAG: Mu-like prophage major head subunit gpT family protein [Chitinophagaceae bacterium]|nr:Mu-like prophage major head subunit gpT family protein [Chitinophagaceae bacterium]
MAKNPPKIRIADNSIRAQFDVQTFNESERTIEVVFATEAEVVRNSWDGRFIEILDCRESSVRLERINSGGPVLNNHSRWSLEDQIGVVVRAWIAGKQCRALVKFSTRQEVAGLVEDIKNGVIRNVSVGYRVYKYEVKEGKKDEISTYRALDWEPMELSMVPVPADFKAQTRADDIRFYDAEIINSNFSNSNTMAKENEERSAETTPAVAATTTPAQPAVDAEAIRAAAVTAERTRVKDIGHAVRSAKLSDEFADKLIADGSTIDAARAAIIDELAKNQPPVETRSTHSAQVTGEDESVQVRSAMEEAILHRAFPDKFKIKTEKASDFRGFSMVDYGRSILERNGVKAGRLTGDEVVSRALATTDYPALLGNVVNTFLRSAYDAAPQTWKPLATQYNASDFKQITGVQFGGNLKLEKVNEHGEYKYGKLEEAKESFKLETYGKIVAITRQALVNDDLNGFARLSQLFGHAAANLESDIMWGLITGNVTMGDGKSLFHTDHKNLAGSGAAPAENTLTAARVALFKQTGSDGEKINVTAKYLVVPIELLVTAQKLMTAVTAGKTADVNVFNGAYEIITDGRLTDTAAWYLAAAPGSIDVLAYAYLNGQGLYTETRNGFDVDGVEVKARLDFAGAAMDYRGLYKNPGA